MSKVHCFQTFDSHHLNRNGKDKIFELHFIGICYREFKNTKQSQPFVA